MREPAFWHRPPSWISRLLMPLGVLYGAVAGQRLQREGFDAGIPVLCVGNYHTGGAGKTPTVLALTRLLRDLGETPVVLSRGYGGRLRGPVMVDLARHAAADVGDEPLMLAATVPVAVARDRLNGVALARSQGASVILMDDGFQNAAVAKDAALIVIDASRGLARHGRLRAQGRCALSEGGAWWLAAGGVLAATATTVSAVAPNRRIRPPKAMTQTANQAEPSAAPAMTSVSQWTSRRTRLEATASVSVTALPARTARSVRPRPRPSSRATVA